MVSEGEITVARRVLAETKELLYDEDRWCKYAFAATANHFVLKNPMIDDACRWCLTGAVYKAIGDEHYFLENVDNDERFDKYNPLLTSAFADALQEMDETGRWDPDVGEEGEDAVQDQMQEFNDRAEDHEWILAFLDYAGKCLELKIDHIRKGAK